MVLRPATARDAMLLLDWRNDSETRAASFQQEAILPEEHRLWLERSLADPECLIWVLEEHERPIGSLRLQRQAPGVAEIHIVLAPEARGMGLAAPALVEGSHRAFEELGVATLLARVKTGNAASLRAFR